jgi:hypothetical protein
VTVRDHSPAPSNVVARIGDHAARGDHHDEIRQFLAQYRAAFKSWQSAPPALRPMIIGRIVQLEFEVVMTWNEEDAEALFDGRVMPNLRECTKKDIQDIAEFFTQLSKAVIEACEALNAMPAWLVDEQ